MGKGGGYHFSSSKGRRRLTDEMRMSKMSKMATTRTKKKIIKVKNNYAEQNETRQCLRKADARTS